MQNKTTTTQVNAVDEAAEFCNYIKNERDNLCRFISSFEWRTDLRTHIDDILIAYDQLFDRYKKLQTTLPTDIVGEDELIKAYDEYIKLLGDELDELAVMANNRGWKTKRYEAGIKAREKIATAKAALQSTKGLVLKEEKNEDFKSQDKWIDAQGY